MLKYISISILEKLYNYKNVKFIKCFHCTKILSNSMCTCQNSYKEQINMQFLFSLTI